MRKKFWKTTHIGIWQNLEFISHVPLRSLNIPSLKALTEKFISGMLKMPKSHDQPLCTYSMRYDAHFQSHPISWSKWYLCKKIWNPMKTIQVIIRTPSTHDWTPRFKYKYWNSAKPGTYIMCPHKGSLNIKFESSSWKIDFRNAKNA